MNKSELIKQTFKIISEITNDNFVTIKNFDYIPDRSSIENGIDVMIPSEYINEISQKLGNMGYSVRSDNLQYLYGAEPHIHFIYYTKSGDGIHFDVVTGLYYRSSNDLNLFVKINDELINSMMNNKVKVDNMWMWQPSPEDELVHLCCHTIFDKRLVKDVYVKRIDYLFELCDVEQVRWLLEKAFFKVSDTILKNIKNNKTAEIYENYISFMNY